MEVISGVEVPPSSISGVGEIDDFPVVSETVKKKKHGNEREREFS